jgi:hypothetical protein
LLWLPTRRKNGFEGAGTADISRSVFVSSEADCGGQLPIQWVGQVTFCHFATSNTREVVISGPPPDPSLLVILAFGHED